MKNGLFVLGGISLAALVACGGGSSSSSDSSNNNASDTSVTISGTAATGAAFADSKATVTDSTGVNVGSSSTIGSDGAYSIKLDAGAKAPFVVTATRTGEDGASESLVSVVASVSNGSATANITPITNLIAARLSPSGDPTKLAAELAAKTATLSSANVTSKTDEVQKMLEPIISATDTGSTNPLTGSFSVNGAGYDRLLDSIKISIVPASARSSNIEIGIKQQQADDAAPVAIQFSSADTAAAVAKLPTIDKGNLVEPGTAVLIQSFLKQLTSCYALPLGSRVDSTISGGFATGNAGNVKAAECKSTFFGDNPANFKSNGNLVGRDVNGNGAFGSLFKDGATGVVFSQGSYEFTRSNDTRTNGDIVVGYKSRDTKGNESFDTFALRKDTDGKLKLIGNQYDYGGGVTAYQQLRTFVNDAPSSYYSTGYALNVPLYKDVIAYLKVKTPNGTLTMIPGSDGMVFPKVNSARKPVQKDGVTLATRISEMVPSGTSFVRIRSEYADASTQASSQASSQPKHPAGRDGGLFFTETDAEDSEISRYGNQSVWAITYYNSSNQVMGTQTYKTRARANTIAELRTQKWAVLDDSSLSSLKAKFVANTSTAPSNNSYTKLPSSGLAEPGWSVPSGALPPTSITLYGKDSSKVNFADAQSVGSTKRSSTITCANGSGETHCVAGGTGYTAGAYMTGLHLWARDLSGREYASFYATYNLN